ncbi:endonuclease/exonuclease/phosphatase family protein [Patescibacteria group bacterium]
MKILSYNVMQGGFEKYSFDQKEPKRINLIKKVVASVDADFVSLIDTFRWDTHFTSSDLKSLFGYEYVYCINLEDKRLIDLGHNNGITVLTRFPNPHFETIRLSTRNAVKTSIEINRKQVFLFSVYLDDLSEKTRVSQIESLKKHIDDASKTSVMGDMNSFESKHLRKIKMNIKKVLSAVDQAKKPALVSVAQDMMKGKTIEEIKKIGLRNVSNTLHPTATTPLSPLSETPFIQLDYAFVGSRLNTKNFKVLINETTSRTSDHYPICFEVS